jgi:hypothetical protein
MSDQSVLFVSRGRSIIQDKATHGPGTSVTLPHEEAAFLTKRGFLQAEMPLLPAPATAANPAAIGLQRDHVVQGPQYRR